MSKNDTELAKLRTENARLRRIIEQQDAENADVTRLQLENENFKAAMKQQDESIKALEHDRNSLFAEWDANMAKSTKGEALRPLSSVSRVRKVPKAAEILENFPNVVWTGTRDPKTDRKVYEFDGSRGRRPEASEVRKRLVAPMAGFISAGMEITLVWPSEYAKTQLQLNRGNADFKIMRHIMSEGFGIYRGLVPMLIGAPIQGLLRFGSLDFMNNQFRDENGKVGRAAGFAAGISAGCLESLLVVTPMETIKTRLIHSGKGLADGVSYVVKKDGVGGLYKGLFPTMAKSCSNQALRFFIFNEYKSIIIGNRPEYELSVWEALLGGMTAGCLGACGNTPFDTIKTRMQGLEAGRYSGLGNCALTMVKEEGVFSLWKGLSARLMRVVPGQGIIFCSYESINTWLVNNWL